MVAISSKSYITVFNHTLDIPYEWNSDHCTVIRTT